MKKKLLISLLLILLLTAVLSFSLADLTFTFGDGISFGDTIDDVQSKESGLKNNGNRTDTILHPGLTLSGIGNTLRVYGFDDNGKLDLIQLVYGEQTWDDAIASYKAIEQGLRRKYGAPVEDLANAEFIVTGAVKMYELCVVGENGVVSKELYDKNQWVIEVAGNKKVVIEHVLFRYFNDKDEAAVRQRVTYQYLDSTAQPDPDPDL